MKRYVLFGIILISLLLWAGASFSPSGHVHAQSKARNTAMSSSDCLACHNDPDLAKEVDGKIFKLHVSEQTFGASAHGSLDCVSCHSDVKAVPHESTVAKVNCSECHTGAVEAYNHGLHAKAIKNGNDKAANCLDCHGNAHEILPSTDQASRVNHANIANTCGSCHGEKFVMENSGISARPFLSYKESVHGRAVAAGNANAAVCTDCHGSHDIRPPTDAESTIAKFNVPRTCSKCHEAVASEFSRSIHGQSLARGNWQAPVCTDCHGIHMIKPHIDPTSSVAAQALAKTTCAQCHEGVRLSQEFGVAGRRASSYLDSYHGMASKLGSAVVANCASCHGVHNILPSSDPKSMISRNNLVETCGKCHPGASDNFILGKIHLDVPLSQDAGSVATRWVRWIYLSLIVVVIGGMVIHNGLIWRKKAAARRSAPDRTIIRLTANQRFQHWLLLSSFFVLVLTGFALQYPESWLATGLGLSETIRRLGHRIAAVVMLIVGLYHVGYVFLTSEGRKALKDSLPKTKDVFDVLQNMRFYLGISGTRPQIGRFGYAEKAEYWAVVWGTIVMGVTGLMVWFKLGAFGFLPRWLIDVALAIHFYEAILATLAIVVWHFYHVIFDPDVYPINWAVVDGRMSEEQFKEEHPLAYQEWVKSEGGDAKTGESSGESSHGYEPSPAPGSD
jgi:formate dehydrogenase gamma subunit